MFATPAASGSRADLTVWQSRDETASWVRGALVWRGPAGYSDMMQLNITHTAMLFEQFKMAEEACKKYLAAGWKDGSNQKEHLMALPAYDQCIKASHVFNLLDARGVISVTERASYIGRVRDLAKACGDAWIHTEAGRAA